MCGFKVMISYVLPQRLVLIHCYGKASLLLSYNERLIGETPPTSFTLGQYSPVIQWTTKENTMNVFLCMHCGFWVRKTKQDPFVFSPVQRERVREKNPTIIWPENCSCTQNTPLARTDGRTDMRIIAFVSFAGKKIMCSGCPRKVHDGGAMAIIHNSTSIKRVFLQGFSFVFLERKSNNTC